MKCRICWFSFFRRQKRSIGRLEERRGDIVLVLALRNRQREGDLMEDDQSQQLLSWSRTCEDHKERIKDQGRIWKTSVGSKCPQGGGGSQTSRLLIQLRAAWKQTGKSQCRSRTRSRTRPLDDGQPRNSSLKSPRDKAQSQEKPWETFNYFF